MVLTSLTSPVVGQRKQPIRFGNDGMIYANKEGIMVNGRFYTKSAWDEHIYAERRANLRQKLLIQHLDKPFLKVGDKTFTTKEVLQAVKDSTKPDLTSYAAYGLSKLSLGLSDRLGQSIARKSRQVVGADVKNIAKNLGLFWDHQVDRQYRVIKPLTIVDTEVLFPQGKAWELSGGDTRSSILTYVPEVMKGTDNSFRIELSPFERALRTLVESGFLTKLPEEDYFKGYTLDQTYGLTSFGKTAIKKTEQLKEKNPVLPEDLRVYD